MLFYFKVSLKYYSVVFYYLIINYMEIIFYDIICTSNLNNNRFVRMNNMLNPLLKQPRVAKGDVF